MLCPTDLAAGGTWLGLNDRGVFSAITNRFGVAKLDSRRSRGVLVLEALEHGDARAAAAKLSALDPLLENAFHLVIADREAAFLIVCDGVTVQVTELEPGLHLVTERSFNAGNTTREAFIHTSLDDVAGAPPSNERLEALLASHRDESFEGLCVHLPGHKYGTRSSAIIRYGIAREDLELRFADGPPHATRFVPIDTRALITGSR